MTFGVVDSFLESITKAQSMKEIIHKLDLLNWKGSALQKTLSREWEDKPQTGRKNYSDKVLLKNY